MNKIEIKIKQISDLKIQGATSVAMASLDIAALASNTIKDKNKLISKLNMIEKRILKQRPTEPLLQNFYFLLNQALKNFPRNKISLTAYTKRKIKEIREFYIEQENKIIKNGSKLIKRGNIFTHCHSSLVEKILIESRKRNKNFKVYNTETRPLFQGRITARNLIKNKIKVTMVSDSAAAFLISDHSGDKIKIDKVVLGADVIGLDGSAVNKIGSFGIALTAFESKIPLYIAASLMKIDSRSDEAISIKLEKREAKEIWPQFPKGLKITNFAFDYIPAKFITGFITEYGLIKPKNIKSIVKKKYACLLK